MLKLAQRNSKSDGFEWLIVPWTAIFETSRVKVSAGWNTTTVMEPAKRLESKETAPRSTAAKAAVSTNRQPTSTKPIKWAPMPKSCTT